MLPLRLPAEHAGYLVHNRGDNNVKVPLLDLKAQYAQIKDQVVPVVLETMENQAFILGPRVEKLEKELAAYLGTKHALGVSSGTDALLLALMALGIEAGDEIITTPYTFFATAGTIARLGAKSVFVDIRRDTYNINPELLERAITKRTKAIIPVHLYGQCADMDAINAIAQKHGIPVLEDACQAISASYKGKKAGNIGTVSAFSFFPSKNLGGFGDGGLVATNDSALHDRMKILRVHGTEQTYIHRFVGMNGRLDALQAVVLSVKLPHLDQWSEGRRRNAQAYNRLLAGVNGIVTPVESPGCYHIYNQYVIRVPRRDELKAHLTSKEIGCAVYYPLSLHLQECFRSLGYKAGDFPESERASQETLALPVYPELPAESLDYVASTIKSFVTGGEKAKQAH